MFSVGSFSLGTLLGTFFIPVYRRQWMPLRQRIRVWRRFGYHVSLFLLRLPDAGTAITRVAMRVRQGGHDIPMGVIRRRFAAGLRNFETVYKPEVDAWALYDNAGDEPILLEWSQMP